MVEIYKTCRYTYNFGEKSTDDVGLDSLSPTSFDDGKMDTFAHFPAFRVSLSLSLLLLSRWSFVCSLEVLVDVGERGGAQVVVGHGLNDYEAFSVICSLKL